MGGAYIPGLKSRPGDKAGEPCEGPGCVRTESSGWWADGRCCSSRSCKRHFDVLGKENKKPNKRARLTAIDESLKIGAASWQSFNMAQCIVVEAMPLVMEAIPEPAVESTPAPCWQAMEQLDAAALSAGAVDAVLGLDLDQGEPSAPRLLDALRVAQAALRKERERLNRRLRADKAEDTEADELASDEAELDELQSKIEALRAERGTPLVSKLSSAQQKELKAAEKALPKLEAADAAAETALEGALEKKRALEALLHSNLQRQLDELRQQLEEGGGEGDASQGKESGMLADERASVLASKEEALTRAVAATAVAEERLEAGRDELDAVRQRFHAAEARCEEARSQLARLVDQRQRQEKEFERVRVCAVPLLLVCAVTALDTQSDITVQSDIAHPRWIRAAPIAHPPSLSLSRTHARTACRQDSPRRGEARGRDA